MNPVDTPADLLRIEHVRIIDGTDAAVLEDGVLTTAPDGRIDYVGPAAGAPPSPRARTVDGRGRTLVPGFIDTHVHFAMEPGSPPFHSLRSDPALLALEAAERMERTLRAGVTTVRDLMGTTRGYRTAHERGLIRAPKMKLAVFAISHTGGHADGHLDGGAVVPHLPSTCILADSVPEVRVATRRILRAGADVIKICTTGGMSSEHDQPDDEGLTLDEVRAAVDEASRHGGRPVAAHAQGAAGILTAIQGGVTSVEHGYGIDDEGLDLLCETGTFLVPTLSTVFEPMDSTTTAPHHREKKLRWKELTERNIARAIARGAKIAMGTDAGVVRHGRNLRELSHLVALGMSPQQAIEAGTSRAAELLGLTDTGVLRPGAVADFVLVDGEPDRDIAVLSQQERIVMVGQDGRVVVDATSGVDTSAVLQPA